MRGSTLAGTAVVVGVGAPSGLGAALARRFAREGLRVVVAGRTEQRLTLTVEAIRKAGGIAEAKVTDATRQSDIAALFDQTEIGSDLELVAYNVGNNIMLPSLETDAEIFEKTWRQNALGGFLVGQAAMRRFLPKQRGTLLFTGATASVRARPPFIAFASAKAALRAVAQGLAREFGPQGIHVAHVIIDGVIQGEYAQSKFPEFVKAKGADGLLHVDAIADTYWGLHCQPRSAWTHELDLRPFKEPF
ncbi:glucose 1-dehydrogenase [Beijerinckiaceae bacterium]|nr:glucose 1-dehydrogenase [Beijerinckiaceae bacterium]